MQEELNYSLSKNKNPSDFEVSTFSDVYDTNPETTSLENVLTEIRRSDKLNKLCLELRSIGSKKQQQDFKKKNFPAFTPSGVFFNGHQGKDIVKHSGLLQIDIDRENISDPGDIENLKQRLIADPFSYVLFISPSGQGIKILVLIDSTKHIENFAALQKYYKQNFDLAIDAKCKDVGRLCFMSYDPQVYINENASIFDIGYLISESISEVKLGTTIDEIAKDAEYVVKEIENKGKDITQGYDNWLKICFALANGLGEKGRILFHRLSCLHPEYDKEKTDKQYNSCLKKNRNDITIKSFFYIAKQHGINIGKNYLGANKRDDVVGLEDSKLYPNEIIFYEPKFDNKQNIIAVNIIYTKLYELLLSFGFRRFDLGNDDIMVKIDKNIIEEVSPNIIQDCFFTYINSLPDVLQYGIHREMLIEKFNKSPETYFSKKKFSLLRPEKEYEFVRDTKDKCFVFYRNGFVECTKDSWQLKDYKKLHGCIWKNQLLDRDFSSADIESADIAKVGLFGNFVFNISKKDNERFASLCTIIGYNLHTYFEGKLKATILTDSKISDFPDGRTGKSLLIKGLSKIKKTCVIKGKDFDPTDKFKYQEADLDNQIVTVDDARRNLNFELMFNDITEGIKVNKKNIKPFTIKAKILITTNRTIKIEGASAKDRSIEFELADYYSEKFSPEDEFKKWFFGNDFSHEDWVLFDNFMMFCISLYLENGVQYVSSINLNRRKLIESTNEEFVEFMDGKVANGEIKAEEEYLKKDLHDQFLKEYPEFYDNKKLSNLKAFTLWLRLYAKHTDGFSEIRKEDERKSNEKRYITFRSDKNK